MREEEPSVVHKVAPRRADAPALDEGVGAEAAEDLRKNVIGEDGDDTGAADRVHGPARCVSPNTLPRNRTVRIPPVMLADLHVHLGAQSMVTCLGHR